MTSYRVQDWASASVRPSQIAVTVISASPQKVKAMAPLSGCGSPVKGDREFFFLFFRHCSSFLSSLKETKQRKVRNVFEENTTHEEAFIGCTIIGIFFDSCVAYATQVNRHEKLFERSEFFE